MNPQLLRKMEAFTQAMFDRIIGFQEKDAACWDEAKPFEQRIAELPLHYLIFSNPDRNPASHGPTVNHYYPLRWEMRTLANYARLLAPYPRVLDVHGRNGFIGSLLAREGVSVLGLVDPDDKPNQIENFYDAEVYQRQTGRLSDYAGAVDLLLSSWMPSGDDISADVLRLKPGLVVYIYTDHDDADSGQRQTGSDGAFGENLTDEYRLLDSWQVVRQRDLLKEVWPDLTGNIEEVRQVRIYAHDSVPEIQPQRVEEGEGYAWEEDLLMAENALEAKREMQARGFPF